MASRIAGIVVEIGGDTTKLTKALKGVDKTIKGTQTSLKDINKLLKLDPGNTELLSQKQKQLKTAIQETKDRLTVLQEAAKNSDLGAEQHDALQREIAETEQQLKSLEGEYRSFGSVAKQQLQAVGQKMQEIGAKVADVGKNISSFGQTLTTRVTLPLAAVGTAAVANFAEVDKTMTLTNQTMGNTADQAALLDDAMKQAAMNSTFGMGEAAEATLNFARAGLSAEQAASALAPAMNLAAGEGGDLNTVSAGLVATINGFHGSFEDASVYADVFAAACNNSALDINSLSNAMSTAAPIFASAGYSVQDAALYMGIMANNGIDADKAANSLKTGIARLVSPAKDAADKMKELGISVTNSDGSMKDSVTIQKELHDAFANLSESEQIAAASAIFGKNQMAPWLALINTAPSDVNKLSSSLKDCAGTTTEMADAMMGGFGGSIEKLKSSFDVLGYSVGQALAPTIQKVVDFVQQLTDKFNSLSPAQQEMIAKFGLLAAAVGPVILVVGKLVSGVGTLITAGGNVVSMLSGLATPAGLAVTAIAGVTAAAISLKNHMDTLTPEFKISAAFSDFTLDTTPIDTAIEVAEQAKHEMEVQVQMKAKLAEDSQNLVDFAVQWLTDGKVETEEEKDDFRSKADDAFAPVFDAITESYNEKKTTLDNLFDSGIIDEQTYNDKLESLKTSTDNMKSSLETEKQAFVDYAIELANQSVKPTEDQLAHLQELADQITANGDKIIEANNAALQRQQLALEATVGGYATTEDIAIGVKYVVDNTQTTIEGIEQSKSQALADLHAQVANGEITEEELQVQYNVIQENAQASIDAAIADGTTTVNSIFAGISEKFPEESAKVEEIARQQNIAEKISQALLSPHDEGFRDRLQEVVKQFFPDLANNPDIMSNAAALETELMNKYNDVKTNIAAEIGDGEWGEPIMSAFGTAIATGALDNIDLSSLDEAVSNAVKFIDLTDDGKTAGETLPGGLAQGIESDDAAIQASIANAKAINDAWKSEQDSHSPSKVWKGFGEDLIAGLKQGFEGKQGDMTTAAETLATEMNTFGTNAVTELTNGMTSVDVATPTSGIVTAMTNALNPITSAVSTIFGGAASTITEKMNTAKSAVSNAIDAMKRKFNFRWSLPSLKLPHISVSGKFSLNPPMTPKFNLQWYRKAMDNAMILNSPTIFGAMGGKLLGGGEAGNEVIAGESHLMGMINGAVSNAVNGAVGAVISVLEKYLPDSTSALNTMGGRLDALSGAMNGMQVVLDSGALVGETSVMMDKQLGTLAGRRGRNN